MRQFLRAVLIGSLVLTTACHLREKIADFSAQPIPARSPGRSLDEIAREIKAAGTPLDWTIEDAGPGKLIATHGHPKGFAATVEISFTQTAYSITLLKSERLYEKDGAISTHYNAWARDLKAAIDRQLASSATATGGPL